MKTLIGSALILLLLAACSTQVTTPLQAPSATQDSAQAVNVANDVNAPTDAEITPTAEQELSIKDMDELDKGVIDIDLAFS